MKFSLEWLKELGGAQSSPSEAGQALTRVGLAVDAVEGEGGSAVLDVDIPSNRPDCLGHRGLARELCAASGSRLPAAPARGTPQPDPGAPFPVDIEAPSLCPRYTAVRVGGLRDGSSPDWMRRRLERSGMRPRSLIVDITNYVMLESGQPLHAFDFERLRGGRLSVRAARANESLTTLDGVARRLAGGELVIADAESPVALAGVMGALESEIRDGTREVVIESACFDPASVRRVSRELGLRTEASHRFERGVDPQECLPAAERAAALMAELASGRIKGGAADLYPGRRAPLRLRLRRARLRDLLGIEVDAENTRSILERLEFRILRADEAGFELEVPSFRLDVGAEEDLIEEVARHFGYDRIPSTLPPSVDQEEGPSRAAEERSTVAGAVLQAHGFAETVSTVFVQSALNALFADADGSPVRLLNPLSETGDELRRSLLPGLLSAVRLNLNRGASGAALYEVGAVFLGRKAGAPPEEDSRLGLAAAGSTSPPLWDRKGTPLDLYDLKGALEETLARGGWPELRAEPASLEYLQPGRCARLSCGGQSLGFVGQLSPATARQLEIDIPVTVAEVSLDALARVPPAPRTFRPSPRTPAVSRDLALVVPRRQGYAEVAEMIRSVDSRIVRVEPFDRYESDRLGRDSVGLALRVIYHHPERTLVSEEVEELERRILQKLRERFGITLRAQ
jgi:phenylalanyl-tRNA synthetase beta chain